MEGKKAGRRCKLTLEVTEAIVAAVSNGLSFKTAAAVAGISQSTFQNWLSKGREGKKPFSELLARLEDAQELGKAHVLLRIRSLANGGREITRRRIHKDAKGRVTGSTITTEELPPSLAASTWWLERRFPEEFGPKQQVAVTNGDNPFEVSLFGSLLPGSEETELVEPETED